MPFGCPGEDAQCQAMVQVVCNIVDFGMNTQAAIEAPRVISRSFPWTFHPHAYEPGLLTAERRIAPEVREGLERLGHRVRELPEYSPAVASVCAIRLLGPGTLEGGADPRRESADIDFPTDGHTWLALADRGVQVEFVRSPDRVGVPLELFARAVDERTALVCTGHVYYTSGYIQDVKALAEICHRKGTALVVDAYQSIGALDFDVHSSGVDFLVGGTLKWLMGGPGMAFLYARRDRIAAARPSALGWWAMRNPFDFDVEHVDLAPNARRFEYGTPAVAAAYTARAGLSLVREVGVATVRRRHMELSQRLVDGARAQGWTVRSPTDASRRSPIVTLEHPDPPGVVAALRQRGLICDNRPGLVRLSPHYFNTLDEMDRALALLAPLRATAAVA